MTMLIAKDDAEYGCLIQTVRLPKKDDNHALRELKQQELFKRIPIVVFTGTEDENEIGLCCDPRASRYIIKPTTFNGLLFL